MSWKLRRIRDDICRRRQYFLPLSLFLPLSRSSLQALEDNDAPCEFVGLVQQTEIEIGSDFVVRSNEPIPRDPAATGEYLADDVFFRFGLDENLLKYVQEIRAGCVYLEVDYALKNVVLELGGSGILRHG